MIPHIASWKSVRQVGPPPVGEQVIAWFEYHKCWGAAIWNGQCWCSLSGKPYGFYQQSILFYMYGPESPYANPTE